MKTIIASVFIVAVAYGELPPSNSYLPPPPGNQNGAGYPQGPSTPSQSFVPQIVSARTLGGPQTGATSGGRSPLVNPFGRSGNGALSHDHAAGSHASGRFANEEPTGYNANAANFARNGLEDINADPANYNFGYMVNDYQEGTDFGHHEERQEARAQGEYHVVLPDGRRQTVSYEADERGFKPQITYEETENLGRSSGYDSNAHNLRSNNHDGHFGHANGGHDSFGARSNGY